MGDRDEFLRYREDDFDFDYDHDFSIELGDIDEEDNASGTSDATNDSNNEEIDVKRAIMWEALSWAKVIAYAVIISFLMTRFIIVNASVPTGSMEGTIRSNDRIIAFRLSYTFANPDTFDIIVFRGPDNDEMLYVKRIVGLPGDTVNIVNGQVFINNESEPLRDDFVHGDIFGNYGPFEVPEGHFFVLGDNRGNSIDSRSWRNAFVSDDKILGRVIFRYFPGFRNLTNT